MCGNKHKNARNLHKNVLKYHYKNKKKFGENYEYF